MHWQYFKKSRPNGGFTLIELLVVIAIIALLGSIIISSLNRARARARDAVRISDMAQIKNALALYYNQHSKYPRITDFTDNPPVCGGWDVGYNRTEPADQFIQPLIDENFFSKTPGDPNNKGQCDGYVYYKYDAGQFGCDAGKAFYVLGIAFMESTSRPDPTSPGFSCNINFSDPSCAANPKTCAVCIGGGANCRNWNSQLDWVTGGYE